MASARTACPVVFVVGGEGEGRSPATNSNLIPQEAEERLRGPRARGGIRYWDLITNLYFLLFALPLLN